MMVGSYELCFLSAWFADESHVRAKGGILLIILTQLKLSAKNLASKLRGHFSGALFRADFSEVHFVGRKTQ